MISVSLLRCFITEDDTMTRNVLLVLPTLLLGGQHDCSLVFDSKAIVKAQYFSVVATRRAAVTGNQTLGYRVAVLYSVV